MRDNSLSKSLSEKRKKKKSFKLQRLLKRFFLYRQRCRPGVSGGTLDSIKLSYISQVYYILKNSNESCTLAVCWQIVRSKQN